MAGSIRRRAAKGVFIRILCGAVGLFFLAVSFLIAQDYSAEAKFSLPLKTEGEKALPAEPMIKLPKPKYLGGVSVEQALSGRRTVRDFKDEPLTLEEVSQLLWAAQGVTNRLGYRTAPSAGALYPLEIDLVAGRVDGLASGVYRYLPKDHALVLRIRGDKRKELARASLGQEWMNSAPAMIAVHAVYERVTARYGDRGIRYADIEGGHAGQNICLQAESLGLGVGLVGAFDDRAVREILALERDQTPLYLMPVGRKTRE
ncbi:MAG TPA: SagB/ThcOx family dehydrogenase [Candidatus Omnitrophota bacterium]|nr:SagB/ThcOx family dehydrogenase [Candidatus Omnitrophota bacterium]